MIAALVIIAVAVVAGAGLAAASRRDNAVIGGLHGFAAAAVVSAVLVQLLPEAVAEIGGYALVAFAAAIAAPTLAEPVLARWRRAIPGKPSVAGADLAFYGFAVHQWAEGVAVGAVTSSAHGGAHLGLVLGIAAHTVPMTAVFVAAALSTRGGRYALRRAVVLLVATAAGFATAAVSGGVVVAWIQPWVAALAAGFLVHVLMHGAERRRACTPWSGPIEVLGVTLGAALPFIVGHEHSGRAAAVDAVRSQLGDAFLRLTLETAPMLVIGLALGAGLQLVGSRIPSRNFKRGNAWRQAIRGIAAGVPLPRCACGVLSIAESLRKRGAGPAMVMAFLVTAPELGPETLMLTVRFLGGSFAGVRLAAALLLGLAAAVAFARATGWRPPSGDAEANVAHEPVHARASLAQAYEFFDALVLHTAPWTFVGLVVAAYVHVVLPTGSLAELSRSGLDVMMVALVSIPTYVCAAAATPLAAVLLLKGVSPGAVLVGLLLGPATNVATLGALRRGYGGRAVAWGVLTIVGIALAMGYAVNRVGVEVATPAGLLDGRGHGWVTIVATTGLGAALLVQLWRGGVRAWLKILDPGHDHDHDHAP